MVAKTVCRHGSDKRLNSPDDTVALGSLPAALEFLLVKRRPLSDISQDARGQSAPEQCRRADGDLSGKLAVNGVKMGRRMFVTVHPDGDPKKTTDLRHRPETVHWRALLLRQAGRSLVARANPDKNRVGRPRPVRRNRRCELGGRTRNPARAHRRRCVVCRRSPQLRSHRRRTEARRDSCPAPPRQRFFSYRN